MTYKLGKAPARLDSRTIKFLSVLKNQLIPPTPDIDDVDAHLGVPIDNPMYANDKWGDCVIAGRAHHTRRFECFEQGICVSIRDAEVLAEYWKEQGVPVGTCWAKFFHTLPDRGLVMLDSLNAWRNKGWLVGGKTYKIFGYALLDWKNHDQIYASVSYLRGVLVGIALPKSAQSQAIWDVVPDSDPSGAWGSWGGHCVYIKGYQKLKGLVTIVTWGGIKQMTLAFIDKYLDEAYAIVDNKNSFTANSPVDVVAMDNILKQITGA